MTHHKRSRVGHLPSWQRLSTHFVLTVCAFTGLAYFLKREMGGNACLTRVETSKA